jgi:hypothetical protein
MHYGIMLLIYEYEAIYKRPMCRSIQTAFWTAKTPQRPNNSHAPYAS